MCNVKMISIWPKSAFDHVYDGCKYTNWSINFLWNFFFLHMLYLSVDPYWLSIFSNNGHIVETIEFFGRGKLNPVMTSFESHINCNAHVSLLDISFDFVYSSHLQTTSCDIYYVTEIRLIHTNSTEITSFK